MIPKPKTQTKPNQTKSYQTIPEANTSPNCIHPCQRLQGCVVACKYSVTVLSEVTGFVVSLALQIT